MPEEQGQQQEAAAEQSSQPDTHGLPPSAFDDDGHIRPGFAKGLFSQLQAASEAEKRLQSIEQERQAEKEAQERAKLEREGKYEEALRAAEEAANKRIADYEARVKEMERSATEAKLQAQISRLGVVDNPILEAGLKAMFFGQSEISDPVEWAAEFAKTEHFQGLVNQRQVRQPPQHVGAADRSTAKSVEEMLDSDNPQERAEARKRKLMEALSS
jgi:hypothetical protein